MATVLLRIEYSLISYLDLDGNFVKSNSTLLLSRMAVMHSALFVDIRALIALYF